MRSEDIEKTIDRIWQAAESEPSLQLYSILDTARDSRIYSRLAESKIEAFSLFRGDRARELSTVAPYLVALHRDDSLASWFFNYGWGNSWGIIIESAAGIDALKRHCRSIFMVYDENGKPRYFRYYDPRVIRVYLPTCSAEELQAVFGPVNAFYIEGEEPGALIHCTLSDGQLVERKVPINCGRSS